MAKVPESTRERQPYTLQAWGVKLLFALKLLLSCASCRFTRLREKGLKIIKRHLTTIAKSSETRDNSPPPCGHLQ